MYKVLITRFLWVPGVFLPILFLTSFAAAQTSTVPEHGVRARLSTPIALTNARIVTKAGDVIEDGVVLIEDGIIQSVGDVTLPNTARKIDCEGKTIYPALIEPYHETETSPKQTASSHWNKSVTPEWSVANDWKGNDGGKANEAMRKAGFAVSLLVPKGRVLKGSSVAVSLGRGSAADSIIKKDVAQHIRLTSSRSRDDYPGSPMGAVALARQAFYDARWYEKAWRAFRANGDVARPEANAALDALSQATNRDALFVFDAIDEQYALRANRFAVEFGLNRVALRGSGREYQRLDAIVAPGYTFIVPLTFPKPPNVATPEATRDASLGELMHWRLAPENPARLRDAGANILLTTYGLKNKSDFRKQIRKAVERGLDPEDALNACTMAPARMMGIDNKAGTIAVGKAANLMICDGDWLGEKAKIVETWVDGERFEFEEHEVDDFSGDWRLVLETPSDDRGTLYLSLKDDGKKLSGTVSTTEPEPKSSDETGDDEEEKESGDDDEDTKTETALKNLVATFGRVSASFSSEIWDAKNTVRLSATLLEDDESESELIGELIDETGKRIRFTGTRTTSSSDEDAGSKETDSDTEDDVQEDSSKQPFELAMNFPLGAYGVADPNPSPTSVLIENATVWTCGPEGIIENGSILLQDGKITAVGDDITAPAGVKRINAKGKHVTPGIIDCHSHMATDGGVNESTQAITAEVRIGDFIDATDISIFRQLAGGVTTANILHGSANPIGGQNQVIKLRWGNLPEAMKFAEAPGGIKFALGENVKQSNWGDDYRSRYPQSRLGVEQIMRDAFIAAKEYEKRWLEWNQTGQGIPPRRDLELDALLQIVNRERWIHCHSYRQDEILGLIRTLDDFGITIGTFQHILEGYKVAKEMADHGAMGSSFSDWWAYKFEVLDAIPYNGALMHEAGIVVSFNSDDTELARHLNHEAGKALKYGSVPREEALNFVTLNPAKQLRIDKYVGSLEVGKHADVLIWSGDPLQVTSRCEQTWIDGIRYFDIDEEKQIRNSEAETREKLVRMILDSGEDMKKPGEKDELWRDLFPRHDEYCGHGHGH